LLQVAGVHIPFRCAQGNRCLFRSPPSPSSQWRGYFSRRCPAISHERTIHSSSSS